ncbi:MAG: hypothetical protein MMC33_008000 [Icmadophila ericetorum]|nr:hypothetical protein [Icmadophila ericetorum]
MEIAYEGAKPEISTPKTNQLDCLRTSTSKNRPPEYTPPTPRADRTRLVPQKIGTYLHSRYTPNFDKDHAVKVIAKKEREIQPKQQVPPQPSQFPSPLKPRSRSHGPEIIAEVVRRKGCLDAKRLEREVVVQDRTRSAPVKKSGPYLMQRRTTEADNRRIASVSNYFQKPLTRPRTRPQNASPGIASRNSSPPPRLSAPSPGDRPSRYNNTSSTSSVVSLPPRPSNPTPGDRPKLYTTSTSGSSRSTRVTSTTSSTTSSMNSTTSLKSNLKKPSKEAQCTGRRKSVVWSEEVKGIVIHRWIKENDIQDWSPSRSIVSPMPSKK